MMMYYVLLRQNERDDSWDVVVVDQEGETSQDALRCFLTSGDRRATEGVWVAIPNDFWVGQEARIQKIAQVEFNIVSLL